LSGKCTAKIIRNVQQKLQVLNLLHGEYITIATTDAQSDCCYCCYDQSQQQSRHHSILHYIVHYLAL